MTDPSPLESSLTHPMNPTTPAHTNKRALSVVLGLFLGASFASSVALAAPNPLCPGLCAESTRACGADSDCEGVTCELSPTCLPAAHAHLIWLVQRVIPEGPGGLNDPRSGWSCGLVTCEPAADQLAIRSTYGSTTHAAKDLALTPGRYLLLAELTAEPMTWGALSVVAPDLEAWTEPVVSGPGLSASEWPSVSAYFALPVGHRGPIQVRLHADGPGRVALRRAVLLQLRESGVYLRAHVGTSADWTLEATRVLVSTPSGRALADVCDASSCIPTELARLSSPSSPAHSPSHSDWLDLSALSTAAHVATSTQVPPSSSAPHTTASRMTVAWRLCAPTNEATPGDCTPAVDLAVPSTVTFELAFAPDADAIVWRAERPIGAGLFSLVLPHAPAITPGRVAGSIHPFELRGAFVADAIAADIALGTTLEAPPITSYRIAGATAPIDLFDEVAPPDALTLLAKLGLTAASFLTTVPSPTDRARAAELGLVHRVVTIAEPLSLYSGDLDLDGIDDHFTRNLSLGNDPAMVALRDDLEACADRPTSCLVRIDHTNRTFVGPLHRAAFHTFLADLGETPDALGLARLEDAEPIATWPSTAPSSAGPAARLHLRAVEFLLRANARALERIKGRIRALAPVAVGVTANGRTLAELSILSEERALSALIADIGAGPDDDCQSPRIAAHADLVASVSVPWREAAAARGDTFVTMAEVSAGRADTGLIMAELAARGISWFEHQGYGPFDVSPSGGHGGLGASSGAWIRRIHQAHTTLAGLEPWLFPTRRQPSPFVIVAAESDPLLVAAGLSQATTTPASDLLDSDELGWHTALTHAHLPVDFMLETDIAQGLLEHPVFARRFLVVTRNVLSAKAWDAVVRWVEAGNTLVLGPEAASRDELGNLDPDRTAWLGAATAEPRRGGTTLRWVGPLGVSSVLVPGDWREVLALIGTPIAISSDDRPVVVRVPRGRGRVIVSGVPLGAIYRVAEGQCDPRRPDSLPRYTEGYSSVLRSAMAGLTQATASVRGDNPQVSLTRFTTPAGRAFVLAIPWTTEPEPIALTFPEAVGCESVREELEGVELPLTFGSLFTTLEGPAIFTWRGSDVCSTAVEAPEQVEPEPEPSRADDGCRGGGPVGLAMTILFLVIRCRRVRRVASARRASRSRRSPTA
jgi:hypothetical protein